MAPRRLPKNDRLTGLRNRYTPQLHETSGVWSLELTRHELKLTYATFRYPLKYECNTGRHPTVYLGSPGVVYDYTDTQNPTRM